MSYSFLIEGLNGPVLIDAGSRGKAHKILHQVQRLGHERLQLIYITHAHLDHYGSAAELRRLTGAPIAVHRADAPFMNRGGTPLGDVRGWGRVVEKFMPLVEKRLRPESTKPDILLDEGARLDDFGIDAVVLHTPGHTPGSTTLLAKDRLAFVGDLVSTRGIPHPQLFYATNWSELGRSIRRLQELGLERLYTGHGRKPMTGEVFGKIKVKRA